MRTVWHPPVRATEAGRTGGALTTLRHEGGCGRMRTIAEPVDAEVRDVVLAALDGPELREALEASDNDGEHARLLHQLRVDGDALAELEVAHDADGHLSKPGYLAARAKLPGADGSA